ncbi:aminotransferase class I/II-fold pyridoxal phosphate-dependent enzyme [Weissella sagaensis]|jgi:aromatic-amino-acid transaminase/aminotransferase|uniref:aminotransferase class I/II-fold pyridoxal phosphate-dependent enzyme n=1 Tax=Weissella sagaensis TaxID=2559928 RepID=UPI0009DCB81C|nr:aminotransferase class I/II-fold pyridoxal phosphate-dependent enzyme [Weissella sagaensis]KAA8434444.1 aminotransferase class I/II-fold pyridoxal phosphate-dependent enzyme [Weissella paramesenteroides]MBU7567630.1 aminotransferase class I/II-fold pyridoxal phosphate-dependent enzyme [Weissella hellenica]KAA8437404.1 aminotransferase class I/II-fold pyridoxal phosphate-dependent enzyme [Weissella paramesenteroides]QDJ59653.1 aminotransferase class I/II-fold pyridoxal phosphate-dependent enz
MEMTNYLNRQLAGVKASDILNFANFAQQIPNIINFTLGEPDFNTPEHIKQAAIQSIHDDHSHYAPANGTLALRENASTFLANKYQQHYTPDEIIVTQGATEALYTAIVSVLNPGDKVIIPTPTFPLYIADVTVAGGQPVLVNTAATGFKLTPELLAETITREGEAVKMVILNYPSNPTGVVYSPEELKALADVLRDKPIFALCDEIYSELHYDQPHASLSAYLPEQTILVTGVSKSHAMTGWRIGLLCAPQSLINELSKIHQFTITSTATVTQDAAASALGQGKDDALPMRDAYSTRRDYILATLDDLGFITVKPEGAFYIYTKIAPDLEQDDEKFAYDLAERGLVAAVPGSYFGPGGEHYLRLSYATSMAEIKQGMTNLKNYVARQRTE